MPSPIAAIELIKTAMRVIGQIATGETPTADETIDGLRALNDVLERWSVESLAVYASLPEIFATVGGQATYTVGPGGDWDTTRPVTIAGLYTTYGEVEYEAVEWSLADYLAVPVKQQLGQFAERWAFVNDAPLAQVILWPTPAGTVPVTLDAGRVLTQVPTADTLMTLPPGYASALQYAVAEELTPQYGSPTDVSGRARAAKALIKRANRAPRAMQFDSTIMGGYGRGGAGPQGYVGPAPDQWSETQW